MLKINLLTIILISTLLSACGFHKPANTTPLNVLITGDASGVFATEFKKSLNTRAEKSLTVKIGKITQKERGFSYAAGVASSHMLTVSVPITISRNKEPLSLVILTASTVVGELSSQANRLQANNSYAQLRSEIITKLLRKLKALR